LIFHPSKNCLQKIPNLASHSKKLFCNFKSALVERNNQTIKMSPGTLSWARDRNFFSKFFFFFLLFSSFCSQLWKVADRSYETTLDSKWDGTEFAKTSRKRQKRRKYINNVDNITKTSKTLKTSKYLQNVGSKNHRTQWIYIRNLNVISNYYLGEIIKTEVRKLLKETTELYSNLVFLF
jgi:hypothetical protein